MDLLCNFKISETEFAIKEINQVSQDSYLMVESYRNNLEFFNLQCWALAYQAFFHYSDWLYLFKKNNYNGKY